MLVVTRFQVPESDAGAFRTAAEDLLALLSGLPGFDHGTLGRAADDAGPVGAGHRVGGVGAYRRALSAYDVKMSAPAVMAYAVHEPSAFEVVPAHRARTTGVTGRSAHRSLGASPADNQPDGGHRGQGQRSRSDQRNDAIVSLSKRRGFVYPSSEIYGGTRSAWDYGPLGVELKENIRRQWWKTMVQSRDDVVGLDSAVILAREVWVASGHVDTFIDPLVECQSCHKRFRADHLEEAYEAKNGHARRRTASTDVTCPNCGTKGAFTEPRQFNGLLKTYLGPVETEEGLHYLRPETAQGIFVNFLNVMTSARKKPPFGIAQTGKSFRNEITPGNFIFRTREFEQMEMEFFVEPGTDEEWHEYWLQAPLGLVHRPRPPRGEPAVLRAPAGEAVALLEAHRRHRVPLQLRRQGVRRARGHRQPHRLRPDRPLQALGRRPVLLRPGEGRALDAVRHRAGARPDPRDAGVPARRVHRGRGAQRQGRHGEAHRDALRPAARAGQGRGAAAVAQRRPDAEGEGPRGHAAARAGTSSSTTPARSAAATAARTRSARRSASRSTSTPWTTRR